MVHAAKGELSHGDTFVFAAPAPRGAPPQLPPSITPLITPLITPPLTPGKARSGEHSRSSRR